MAVRKFYQSVDQSTACDPALLADILSGIRRDVEQSVPVGSAANGSCTPQMDTGEPWILCLIRQMLCEASEALMTPSSVELEEGAVGHGGRAAVAAASAAGIPSEARNFDSILGSRAEEDVRMQFCALSEDLREIFDSDLFVEALQQALEEAQRRQEAARMQQALAEQDTPHHSPRFSPTATVSATISCL